MRIKELYREMSKRYPEELSCAWDNDGIMCYSCDSDVKKVLLSLDATLDALKYAAESNCDTLVTHHPMIFKGAKKILSNDYTGSRILNAVKSDINVISFHTRLDRADEGVNDALAEVLGLEVCEKFGDIETPDIGRIAYLKGELTISEFAEMVKKRLGCKVVRVTGTHSINKIAIIGGSGKGFTEAAFMSGADTFITGEIPYNEVQDAAEMGLNVIEAGHFYTENPVLKKLRDAVKEISDAECIFYDSNLQMIV